MNEDGTLVFSVANGNLIAVSDADAGGNPLQVALTATNGTLTLSSSGGLSFTAGDGTAEATMTFTGTAADINAALAGMIFAPTADFAGAASLQIVTSDQGNTGTGGAESATDTIAVTVNPINDAPVVTSALLTISKGQAVTLSGANIGITDPDDASFIYTVVRSPVDSPTSSAAGTPITTFSSADLAGGLVQFVDDGNEAVPSFSVTVNDGDGTPTPWLRPSPTTRSTTLR